MHRFARARNVKLTAVFDEWLVLLMFGEVRAHREIVLAHLCLEHGHDLLGCLPVLEPLVKVDLLALFCRGGFHR